MAARLSAILARLPRKPSDLGPPQLFVGSFAALIAVGTATLLWLPGLYVGEPLGPLDALFTSTSAVCVTGLIVVDTATYFTFVGQLLILVLIQLGGLGMLSLTSIIIVTLGRRLSLRIDAVSTVGADVSPDIDRGRLLRGIFTYTFAVEAVAAAVLWLDWGPHLGWWAALWPAVFHSVSAFCNAGFSTFSDSLVGFQMSPLTLATISILVVVGGIGFITLEELRLTLGRRLRGRQRSRLSLHSRLVLATTALLLAAPWPLFAWFEWGNTLAELPAAHKWTNAAFMSVTPRTAGFNSVDYARCDSSTNFLTVILMFVGGAPGGTAGGVKVTTFALVGMLAWSRLRGRQVAQLWGCSVPEETIGRAVGLTVMAGVLVVVGLFVLTRTEFAGEADELFLMFLFEAVSAFNTVGLSMGATGGLSTAGKVTIIAMMFVGRVGPLTFAAALAWSLQSRDRFRYAYHDVVVG